MPAALKEPNRKAGAKYNKLVQPFLKWAGGKRQLLGQIKLHLPKEKWGCYYEPFVGGGAMLFDLQPKSAHINDTNAELVNLYQVIKEEAEALIHEARRHSNFNSEHYYYAVREKDREEGFKSLSRVQRAARIIYLNKTCYNGLFRVNSQGQFNVPFGSYNNPNIVEETLIHAVSDYFNNADIKITNLDFSQALAAAKEGDFTYLDPPYDPVSDTASFTGYSLQGFGRDEQRRLKGVVDDLTARGCKVLLSNSATDFIRELYAGYEMVEVKASRNINSVASGRGKTEELLIRNYDV